MKSPRSCLSLRGDFVFYELTQILMKTLPHLFFLLFCLAIYSTSFSAVTDKTDKDREQLLGPVNNVYVEISKMVQKDGNWIEEPPMPWLSSTYDPRGHQIEEVQIYTNKALDFTSVFTHDAKGILTEGIEYDAKGNVAFKWTYTKNDTLSKMVENRFQPDGTFFSKATYHYDISGNLVEENRFPPHSKNHFKWIYKYDDKGRKVEESHFLIRSGIRPDQVLKSLNSRLVFSYNRKGVLKKEIRFDDMGEISSLKQFEYKYDKVGNWISQTALESLKEPGEKPLVRTEVTHRKITYHQK